MGLSYQCGHFDQAWRLVLYPRYRSLAGEAAFDQDVRRARVPAHRGEFPVP